ncbi:hypothetical protein IFM89_023512 [Coptis chinensis]|uniref:RING-type E3 ubiquitin transferase n=1 Tax=Coptis chinensis TaxID=261450 RepID=A0A835LMI4_9MAGN|nr:hypothetical protein IFM89_023512 [Coptis chinensis]
MSSPSLQELLVEEGFKGSKSRKSHRSSFGSEGMSMPLYLYNEHTKLTSSSSAKIRTERSRSDVSRHTTGNEFTKTKGVRSQLPRESLLGKNRIVRGSNGKDPKEIETYEERHPNVLQEVERLNARLSEDIPGNEMVNGRRLSDTPETQRFKDIYSNEVFEGESRTNGYSSGFEKKEKYKNSSEKLMLGRSSFGSNSGKGLQKPASSSRKATKTLHSRKHPDMEKSVPEPALDEAAVKAAISILSGYIRRFLKDKEFRGSLRHGCLSCLVPTTPEESEHVDIKVIVNLQEAIKTVERFTEETGYAKELKKASFQLSVITSLNTKELKDGFMSGIPNAQLSACAHLYLSVVYNLQKKDKLSAKHLLQVFCDSPLQARTRLLPELWDVLFLPNLSHLKVWYDQEASSIQDTSSKSRKLKLLEKVYNEILDSGTYQFAVYYKDWLTEGVETPSIPSIHVPSMSVLGFPKGSSHGHSPELASPVGSVSSQPLISKKLYDTVFGLSQKLEGVDEVEGGDEGEDFDNCASSFDGTADEDKRTVTCSPEQGRYIEENFHEQTTMNIATGAPHQADEFLPTSEEECQLHKAFPLEDNLKGEAQITPLWCTTLGSTNMLHVLPHKKANELILKKLAESVFEQPAANNCNHNSASVQISHSMHDSFKVPKNDSKQLKSPCQSAGQSVSDEYLEEESYFSNIPNDFICPLTGELFEEPVTLETGQTFERTAIKEWFDKGKRTCPITGKNLESLGLPITNFVLKRVIDRWKSEHCGNLLAFASKMQGTSSEHGFKSKDQRAVLILEKLLVGFRTEDRLTNAKHLISLGGLQFLILRFELGNLEEKSRILVLLSCCIEADGDCRNYIAKNINKTCLLELLHNKQVKSRGNAVMLLMELICLCRRTEITSFLSSMQKDEIMNTMHVLLVYLQSSPPDQRPLVAVLLLHFDLLVEQRKYSIYREEAVDSIAVALECSLTDEKVRVLCCRALLILGGHISFSGELVTENWLLRHAGFYDGCNINYVEKVEENFQIDETILLTEEEMAIEDWWKKLAASLLGNGRKSFLEIISKCLGCEDSSLVRTCLVTVAWMSRALTKMSDAEFQLSAFTALIPRLKEILENGDQVEHRVLASLALLNFSRISECRVLMRTIGEEIMVPLQSLAVVTWTAKQLYTVISGEHV